MEQLDVEPGRAETRGLGDPVALLEDEQELVHVDLVRAVDLVEAETERGGLLARCKQELRFDVVGPAELVALAQDQLSTLARGRPVLDRAHEDGQRLVDLDLDRRVGALGGRGAGLNLKRRHSGRVPHG